MFLIENFIPKQFLLGLYTTLPSSRKKFKISTRQRTTLYAMGTYISRIKLVNFRQFQEAELELHPRLNVFLGDNGSGKTSILQAISLLISGIFPHCNYKPQIKSLPYTLQNIRSWSDLFRRGKYRLVSADVSGCVGVLTEEKAENCVQAWGLSTGKKLSSDESLSTLTTKETIAQTYNRRVSEGLGIPAFAHYGSHGGAEQGGRRRFSRHNCDYSNPFSAYLNALHPSLDFQAFLEWFSEEEASELREQRKDRSFKSRELEAVRQALSRVFSSGEQQLSDPRFESNPKRFVMTSTSADEKIMELQFDQLSDGYRGMTALVADFARRLALANQYADMDSLQGEGVLIIDEVDAHLHPRWQFRVIEDLHRTFPNVQLIVTTHSPEVVSTVKKESVYILAPKNGFLKETHPEYQTDGNYPQDIAETVMNAPNVMRKHVAFQAYLDCLAGIQEKAVFSEHFENAKKLIINHYGENHPLVLEVDARLDGLRRKNELFSKLKSHISE